MVIFSVLVVEVGNFDVVIIVYFNETGYNYFVVSQNQPKVAINVSVRNTSKLRKPVKREHVVAHKYHYTLQEIVEDIGVTRAGELLGYSKGMISRMNHSKGTTHLVTRSGSTYSLTKIKKGTK